MREKVDFLIIGGGVIAFTLALHLRKLYQKERIVILEKEENIAMHGSGRNSGVLHAGFYYTADSLKAKFTREGNIAWHKYYEEKGLRINKCGKLVIAKNEQEIEGLKELKRRGDINNVPLELITEKEAKEIEPNVKTTGYALWSETTSAVDPKEAMQQLLRDLLIAQIDVRLGEKFEQFQDGLVKTNKAYYEAGYIINAAGLYADKIAKQFGFAKDYCIIPFKGLYLYQEDSAYKPRTNIYPVPNLDHPFLGVHYTLTVDGKAKIGPTSMPAFWRENYQGLDNFNMSEFVEIILKEADLFMRNSFGFRDLAFKEMRKYLRANMVKDASSMLEDVKLSDYKKWGKPGIRAQLIDLKKKKLEMDFIYEGDKKSFHILNAVSPAFTCSWSFSLFLSEQINKLIHNG